MLVLQTSNILCIELSKKDIRLLRPKSEEIFVGESIIQRNAMKISTKTLHEKILFSSIVLRDNHANI